MAEDKPRGVGGPPPRQTPTPPPAAEEPKPVAAASFLVRRETSATEAPPAVDEPDEIDLAFEEEARKRSLAAHPEPQRPPATTTPSFAPNTAPSSEPMVPAAQAPEPYGSEMRKFSFRVPEALRDRYRAAFTFTAAIEGDQTLNDVFVRFVEEDCERRERLYNNGKPYTGGTQPLMRGRPPLRR